MAKNIKKIDELEKKPTVKLISYTIKAVIPTGAYANIQPEITVSAETLQEAEDYVIPHINKLFENFLNRSERRTVTPKVEVKDTAIKPMNITVDGQPTGMQTIITEAFTKASKVVEDAVTIDALEFAQQRVTGSTKLSGFEKDQLITIILNKIKTINGDTK